MHTTHASTQCSVRQQSVHTNWVWLYRFVEYKNKLEKYFYITITSVTIYLCYSWLVISFKWVFRKKLKKNTFWVFFSEAKFFMRKKTCLKKKMFLFRIASLVATCTYMSTSGMHRRPFEGRHLASLFYYFDTIGSIYFTDTS